MAVLENACYLEQPIFFVQDIFGIVFIGIFATTSHASKMLLIRKGTPDDLPQALSLIQELARFENALDEVVTTVEQMQVDGFGPNPAFKMIVAEFNGELVGLAVYFLKYSTWKGKGIYLDDLIVKESFRKHGIGKMLFNAVAEDSVLLNAKQLHWQVLDWNENAINFYKKYNATFDNEWINCKLSDIQLNDIIANNKTNESI